MKIDFHVHPYFDAYGAEDVVNAMKERKVDIAGLAGYNRDIFDFNRKVFDKIKTNDLKVDSDNLAIRVNLKDGTNLYFPRIGEYQNKEGFHILAFGEQEKIKENVPIISNIEQALENECFVVLDHPLVAASKFYWDISSKEEKFFVDLCKKYSGKVALEWNGYCIPLLRDIIDKIVSPSRLLGKGVRYGDVNKKLEGLAIKMSEKGINCPLIADTDLHARKKKDLYRIGTASTIADVSCCSGKELKDSLKEKIFSGDYSIEKGYVRAKHFIFSYAIPVTIGVFSKSMRESMRPRG